MALRARNSQESLLDQQQKPMRHPSQTTSPKRSTDTRPKADTRTMRNTACQSLPTQKPAQTSQVRSHVSGKHWLQRS